MGFDYFVDLYIQIEGSLSVTEGHAIAHELKINCLKVIYELKVCLFM
jgi:divalent metal cation (Fe/Co/Zn/Cd) transporter